MANTPSESTPEVDSTIPSSEDLCAKHLRINTPSPWISRFSHLINDGSHVLDLAAGGGRHGRSLLAQGANVTLIDKNVSALADLKSDPKATVIEADMELDKSPFDNGGVLHGTRYDAVIVVNYLYRPFMMQLIDAINPGGVFLYETFARGNEAFARPRNPDHLLKSGELLEMVTGHMQVIAYEHGIIEASDIPGVKQRICAVKDLENSAREDGDPPVHPLTDT